jgi:hypothetical protein
VRIGEARAVDVGAHHQAHVNGVEMRRKLAPIL